MLYHNDYPLSRKRMLVAFKKKVRKYPEDKGGEKEICTRLKDKISGEYGWMV